MIKHSDIYRENADNCMEMAKAGRPIIGTSEWKPHGSPWLRNRTGLTASHYPLIQMPG
jgi:hypothetical protein